MGDISFIIFHAKFNCTRDCKPFRSPKLNTKKKKK